MDKVIDHKAEYATNTIGPQTMTVTWPDIEPGYVGSGVKAPDWTLSSVQTVGDFGAGGAVAMEGSNDGEHFGALRDVTGMYLQMKDSRPHTSNEHTVWFRPASAGGTDYKLSVIALFRRGQL